MPWHERRDVWVWLRWSSTLSPKNGAKWSLTKPWCCTGPKFPFTAFLGRTNSLTRKQISMIIQICSGHFPLNNHLYKIKKINSNSCTQCSEDQEGPPETVQHFVFNCPAHIVARNELTNVIGLNHFNFKDIMADTNRMKALITFINRTGRLQLWSKAITITVYQTSKANPNPAPGLTPYWGQA